MTEKVSSSEKCIIKVDVNPLNKTGYCYMSSNFSVKQWYFHFKKKHFEKSEELITGSEVKGKHEAILEFLQVKSTEFFRICLKSKEEKYDRQECRSAEEDLEVLVDSWMQVDFIFAAAKANCVLGCISKPQTSKSQDVLSPVLLGTCQATLSIVHPAFIPSSSRETLKNRRRFIQQPPVWLERWRPLLMKKDWRNWVCPVTKWKGLRISNRSLPLCKR